MACISREYKDTLKALFAAKVADSILEQVVNTWELCPSGQQVISQAQQSIKAAVETAGKRGVAEPWPEAIYYGKDGKAVTGSFSGLFKDIFGEDVLHDKVCRITETGKAQCRALSTVENWRNRGMIVKGNGEDPPVPKGDMSSDAIERMYKDWKKHLILTGKKVRIYHPENPDIKKAADKAEETTPITQSAPGPGEAVSEADYYDVYEEMMGRKTSYPGAAIKKRPVQF